MFDDVYLFSVKTLLSSDSSHHVLQTTQFDNSFANRCIKTLMSRQMNDTHGCNYAID